MKAQLKENSIALPKPRLEGKLTVEQALKKRRTVRSFFRVPLKLAEVSQLLWAAQGITDREGNRTSPSPGQTHAIEVYVVCGEGDDLSAGIFHYDPAAHALERMSDRDVRRELGDVSCGQEWLATAPVIFVLCAVPERTEELLGERGPRLLCMEAGHVSENIFLQALALRLGNAIVGRFEDDKVRAIVGLPAGVEPLALIPVGRTR